jgi:hypothetical protein
MASEYIIVNCQTCGRWLVRIHPDNKFDLAPRASVGLIARYPNTTAIPIPQEATCHRLICRFRRWWRSESKI